MKTQVFLFSAVEPHFKRAFLEIRKRNIKLEFDVIYQNLINFYFDFLEIRASGSKGRFDSFINNVKVRFYHTPTGHRPIS